MTPPACPFKCGAFAAVESVQGSRTRFYCNCCGKEFNAPIERRDDSDNVGPDEESDFPDGWSRAL